MKQIRFVPSGCQFWNKNTISSSGELFAYSSTLAVYLYNSFDHKPLKIISVPSNSISSLISSISFNPQDHNQIALTTADGFFFIWNVEKEKEEMSLQMNSPSTHIEWSPFENDSVLVAADNGEIRMVDLTSKKIEKLFSIEGKPKALNWSSYMASRILVGGEDGKIYFHVMRKNKTAKISCPKEEKISVKDLKWDLVSANYFLACWNDGSMNLYDAENTENPMQTFETQSAGISIILWIKSIPGGFVTCNDKIAAVKLWNVSNKAPLQTIKMGVAVILNMVNLNTSPSLGKEAILCSFKNGSIGLFNFHKKKMEFLSEPNHSETVFDVQFKPTDKNILATASYDGTVRIWDITKMNCLLNLSKESEEIKPKSTNFRANIVYAISWSHTDNRLLCSYSSGEILLWDTEKGRKIADITVSNQPVFRLDWNKNNPSLFASGTTEGTAIIYEIANKKINIKLKLKHSGTVFGVAWHPTEPNLLATACIDCLLRVYDTSTANPVPMIYEGHMGKVFNVAWNPLIPNLIASGSDDRTIRITDYKEKKSTPLIGHQQNVRALLWNSEISWLLLSGSWDATIRVWDTRTFVCLFVSSDHYADVYGITSHPQRPFMYVSCSRDTSLRFWNLEGITSKLMTILLSTDDIKRIRKTDYEKEKVEGIKLEGYASKVLSQISVSDKSDMINYYEKILTFLNYSEGEEEFWDIVKVILTGKQGEVTNRILHIDDLISANMSKAQELEASNKGFSYDALNKKRDKLIEASKIYLKLGEFESFCECMVKFNKWDRALAFAPIVSFEYWRSLASRYADALAQEGSEEAPYYYMLANQTNKALDYFTGREEYEEGKVIASLYLSGKLNFKNYEIVEKEEKEEEEEEDQESSKNNNKKKKPKANAKENKDKSDSDALSHELLSSITYKISENYITNGSPLMAAASHLSVKDQTSALIKLLRGNELFYAYILCKIFDIEDLKTDVSLKLVQKAIKLGLWAEGMGFLSTLPKGKKKKLLQLSLTQGKKESKPEGSLKDGNFYKTKSKKYFSEENIAKGSLYLLLGGEKEEFISQVVAFSKNSFKQQNLETIPVALQLFDNAIFLGLEGVKVNKAYYEFTALYLYISMKKAIWKGYQPVIESFYKGFSFLNKKQKDHLSDLPLNQKTVRLEYLNSLALIHPEIYHKKVSKMQSKLNPEQKRFTTAMLKNLSNHVLKETKLKKLEYELKRNCFYLSGSNLPTSANKAAASVSFFTKKIIKNNVYILDDKHRISQEEALMWRELNSLSPVYDGALFNPY